MITEDYYIANYSINSEIKNKNPNSSNFPKSYNSTTDTNREITVRYTQSYCVSFIDIVDSTLNVKKIKKAKDIREYYSIFLNTANSIIKSFDGKVIKNLGDSILYYFPRTMDIKNEHAFNDVLDCASKIIDNHDGINEKLPNGLPNIDYRISADFGKVELSLMSSNTHEIFGSAIDECRLINHMAPPNELIVGDHLYKIIAGFKFKNYLFKQIDLKSKTNMIYSVHRSNITNFVNLKNSIKFKEENYFINHNGGKFKGKEINILLVDDDEDILFSFELMLKNEGYNMKSFSNSKQALDHFLQLSPYHYNLVMLDIRMPDINGIHLYYKLKAINPQLKILFVTALDIVKELSGTLSNTDGINILRKPVDNEQIISKVKSLLMDGN